MFSNPAAICSIHCLAESGSFDSASTFTAVLVARIRDIVDGTSNTILLIESDDDHAVIWTKPDDLVIDPEKPLARLGIRPPGVFLALFADGSVQFHRKTIDTETLAAVFTHAGGEPVESQAAETIALRRPHGGRPRMFCFATEAVDSDKLGAFLTRGIGNQVGLHVYDADPMFDFNLPNFLGRTMGNFSGGRAFGSMDESLLVGLLVTDRVAKPTRASERANLRHAFLLPR